MLRFEANSFIKCHLRWKKEEDDDDENKWKSLFTADCFGFLVINGHSLRSVVVTIIIVILIIHFVIIIVKCTNRPYMCRRHNGTIFSPISTYKFHFDAIVNHSIDLAVIWKSLQPFDTYRNPTDVFSLFFLMRHKISIRYIYLLSRENFNEEHIRRNITDQLLSFRSVVRCFFLVFLFLVFFGRFVSFGVRFRI